MRLNPFRASAPPKEDYGFGTQAAAAGVRLLRKDGDFNVERRGGDRFAYQWLIHLPWAGFFAAVFLYYVAINLIFGAAYVAIGMDGISGERDPGVGPELMAAFFFSVQTFTTVGYGHMAPIGVGHQLLAAFEALVGLLSLALATGLLFARFSRPRNLFIFSTNAVIAPFQSGSGFMFRIANRSASKLIRVSAQVVFSWTEVDAAGARKRQFRQLHLERDQIAMFPLNWTLVHPITEDSPLANLAPEWLTAHDAEFIVQVSGFNETYAREIYALTSYSSSCLEWGARFSPMYYPTDDGRMLLDLTLIGSTEPAPLPELTSTDLVLDGEQVSLLRPEPALVDEIPLVDDAIKPRPLDGVQ